MQIIEFLQGKKTYIMIGVAALDALGAAQGWWEENSVREIVEGALTFMFLRMGVTKSGPVAPKV